MSYEKQNSRKYFCFKFHLRFLILLVLMFQVLISKASSGAKEENIRHFKIISTLEYSGKGQFRNQVETTYVEEKELLPEGKVKYVISPGGSDSGSGRPSGAIPFSYIIDKTNRNISAVGKDLAFWAKVHNESVKSLDKVTNNNIGKTWRQSIDLSSIEYVLPEEMNFTLTAIQVRTDAFGEMIAVRALSEPFFVKISNGFLRSKINSVYLFGSSVDEIYLSISVFEAATSVNKVNETLRHEVATYRTDAAGVPVDLSNIGQDFERLISKVGLSKTSLEITDEKPLPQWAQSTGIRAAQMANICSAVVCEGALNPVASISMPAAIILESQREASIAGTPIFLRLFSGFGWNWQTIGVIGAAIAIPIAISGGGGGGGGGGVASPW